MKAGWLAVLLPALLLAGCGSEEHSDIKAWMREATKDLRGHVPPLPEVKPFPVVSYEPGDLPDPFRSSKIDPARKAGGGGGIKPDFDRRKEELERYPLDAIKFVGLIRDAKLLYAVVTADKRIYRVKIGNHMGQDYGMITDIQTSPALDEGKLVLKELVQDPSGDWVERESVIEMQVQGETK
ncbi:MAG TPA: pilus assembly protein PilP [Rhodocyclaceae bacterium]